MNPESAERVLIFFICLYWIFFACTTLRVLLAIYDVCYRRTTKWTHAKIIHATIAAALLARAIHLTLLHFVNEGKNLFKSAQNEDVLFKILGSTPAHILISVYSLLGLLWLSILVKTYDASPMLIPKRLTLFGRTYDSSTGILKKHLTVFCVAFNVFLYFSWVLFFILIWLLEYNDTVFTIQTIFTSATAVVLAFLFAMYWKAVSSHYKNNNAILSVEKHHLSKRILLLVIFCTVVFLVKLPLVLYISLSHSATWLTSFNFDLVTFTLLEIIPFLVILACTGGKKVEELKNESTQFSFSFRRYTSITN